MGTNIRKFDIKKHVMTGISYVIPIVAYSGILYVLAKGFGGYDIDNAVVTGATPFSDLNPLSWLGFWWSVNKLDSVAMGSVVAVMTAGMAYSIAGRPSTVPGIVIGYCPAQLKTGFLDGLLVASIIGAFANWMKKRRLPKWCVGSMSAVLILVISAFICGMILLCAFSTPPAYIMDMFQRWIISLNGGAKAVIGGTTGACMGSNMGGPVNKTTSMVINALETDGTYGPMAAKIIDGMTPSIGIFIATSLAKKKFTKVGVEAAETALPIEFCFITEGVLPFAVTNPARVIPDSMLGSAVAGILAVGMGRESVAGHGGIFAVSMMTKLTWFLVVLLIDSVVTGVAYAALKRPTSEEPGNKEEEDVDFDLSIQTQQGRRNSYIYDL